MKLRDVEGKTDRLGFEPGRRWRWARRTTQTLALVALFVGPLIGGWQRLDYTRNRSSWLDVGWGLPVSVQQGLPTTFSSDALYQANQVIGGGIAAELFAIPFMDPLAGTLALLAGGASLRTLLALAFPIALAMLAGRVFCGWFCAFGTLSRWLDALCARLPGYRFLALPDRRWLRFVVLAAAVAGSLFGSHLLLYLLLPYLLLQQSVYAAWLLGGGSAIVGVLGGLLFAGILFGPTAYCSALCPTGTALSLLGNWRLFRLAQPDPLSCGEHCDLCNRACWLQLDPGSGDPGPDCDLCGRCVSSCPRSNLLIVGPERAKSTGAVAITAMIVSMFALNMMPVEAHAEDNPALILDVEITRADVTIAASMIDYSDYLPNPEWAPVGRGVELSVFIARGDLQKPAADGVIPTRETYKRPLQIEIIHSSGEVSDHFEIREPNSPISAQRRRIYRVNLSDPLVAGDLVRIEAIEGWLDEAVVLEVPRRGTRIGAGRFFRYFAVSALGFSALLSLSYVGRAS